MLPIPEPEPKPDPTRPDNHFQYPNPTRPEVEKPYPSAPGQMTYLEFNGFLLHYQLSAQIPEVKMYRSALKILYQLFAITKWMMFYTLLKQPQSRLNC